MSSSDPTVPGLMTDLQRERAESLLATAYRGGITDPTELANFMGQTQHESQNFTRLEENLNYRGSVLWDTFKGNSKTPPRNGLTEKEAHELATIPDRTARRMAIADKIYGGQWGEKNLGNTEEHDGHTYRGRGYIQLTGRDNYERHAQRTGLDLIANPDLAAAQGNAEKLAVSYWAANVQPVRSARADVSDAGSIINTGDVGGKPNGLADRQTNATAWEAALGKEGYLESVLERHPAAPTATATPTAPTTPTAEPTPARNTEQDAPDQPLRLRTEHQLSPESLRLIQDSEQQIRQIAERHQLPWDAGLDNTVAAVASQARQSGLSNITHLNVTNEGQIRLAQFDGLTIKETSLDALAAANTDPQRSLGQMAQLDRHPQLHQLDRPHQHQRQPEPASASHPTPNHEAPALSL